MAGRRAFSGDTNRLQTGNCFSESEKLGIGVREWLLSGIASEAVRRLNATRTGADLGRGKEVHQAF